MDNLRLAEADLRRCAWDVQHRRALAHHLADVLLARGTLAYVLLGMYPFGPFYLPGGGPPVYLGSLPEPAVARALGMWLGAFQALMRAQGVPAPSALASAVREELRRRAEGGEDGR